jgi:hypothetical protein
MVTRETIQKRHDGGTGSSINDLIHSQKWVIIFVCGFVEVCEIYAHAPFAIFLFNWHSVSQPLGIQDLANDISVQQSLSFRLDCYHFVIRHLSELLPSRLDCSIDIQFVLDEIAMHTRVIFSGPGKHISILLEELYQPRGVRSDPMTTA